VRGQRHPRLLHHRSPLPRHPRSHSLLRLSGLHPAPRPRTVVPTPVPTRAVGQVRQPARVLGSAGPLARVLTSLHVALEHYIYRQGYKQPQLSGFKI
jgi:hypothetical protein